MSRHLAACCGALWLVCGPAVAATPGGAKDYVSVTDVPGVDPTGVADSTAGLQTAADQGRVIYVPPGDYSSGQIVFSHPVWLQLAKGATIHSRPLCAVTASGTIPACAAASKGRPGIGAAFAVLKFAPGSDGSFVFGGGTIDGNRNALVAQFLALPNAVQTGTYVSRYPWNCLDNDGPAGNIYRDLRLTDCMVSGVQYFTGDGGTLENIDVKNSTKVAVLQGGDHVFVSNLTGENITGLVRNQVVPFWQYAYEIRYLTNFHLEGLHLNGYAPIQYTTATHAQRVGDPYYAAFMVEHMRHGVLTDASATRLVHTDPRSTNIGALAFVDSSSDVSIRRISGRGFYYGLQLTGPNRVTIDDALLDCAYNTANPSALPVAQSAGLRLRGNGALSGNGTLSSAFDHYTQMPAYQVVVNGVVATRCMVGAQVMSGNVMFSNDHFDGNLQAGLLFWATEANRQYKSAAPLRLDDIQVVNSSASYNGGPGVKFNDGNDITLAGLTASDNGQDPATAAQHGGEGITWAANFGGPKQNILLSGWQANDDQAFTIPGGYSFVPGATKVVNGRHQFTIVMQRSDRLHVGQHVLLKNATGSADVDGKIIDLANDVATIATASPATFATTGNLRPLAGTLSMAPGTFVLNGQGTSFTKSILGPGYLLVNGMYLKIGEVISDTQLQMDTDTPSVFNGLAGALVQADVVGVPSQTYGLHLPSGAGASNVSWGAVGSYSAFGNTRGDVLVGDQSQTAPGQQVNGHSVSAGAALSPSNLSTCGAKPSITGNDSSFEVTFDGTDRCTITFATPWLTAPRCTASVVGAPASIYASIAAKSTTQLTLSTSGPLSHDNVDVSCTQ